MSEPGRPMGEVVLASASPIRRALLENAGLAPRVVPASIDEAGYRSEAGSGGAAEPAVVAMELAKLKSVTVSRRERGAIVIGADQVLAIDERIVAKAPDIDAARSTLLALRGRRHSLHSGVAVARDGLVLWTALDSAQLQMRSFSPGWLESYLARAGAAATGSVGAYQLEGLGIQLFDRIEGDFFTILGLPLLPLLSFLRREGVIET